MTTPTVICNESNRVAVRTASGAELFYSYKTLVAVRTEEGRCFQTERKWSRTTSKHLTQFGMGGAEKIPQDKLEALA